MIFNFENHFANCDKYPKAKYQLMINSDLVYSFVTTSRSEKECFEILRDKLTFYKGLNRKSWKIKKISTGEEPHLAHGKLEAY